MKNLGAYPAGLNDVIEKQYCDRNAYQSLYQRALGGGGVANWDGTNLTFTGVFTVSGTGPSPDNPSGHWNIPLPTASTTIPIYGKVGVSSITLVANGFPLPAGQWRSYYFELPIGGTVSAHDATWYRAVEWGDTAQNVVIPPNWVFICARNENNDHAYVGTGADLDYVRAPASFSNGWVNYGGSFSNAGYWRDSSMIVHLRGMVKNGTVSSLPSVVFNLPAGYRPANTHIFATMADTNAAARVDVYSGGNVQLQAFASGATAIGNGFLSFDGITFLAEQ